MRKIISIILIAILLVGFWNPLSGMVKTTAIDWWDPDWEYSKEIIIDHDMVDADLTNFPILFHNTSSDFADHAQSDGDDFAFISSDNTTQYNHEIEYYNSITGELIAWVNIPSLNSTVDTTLYLYYGNPSCSSQENIANTWDNNYVAVWHMQETTGDYLDSTKYNNDGTPTANVNRTGYTPKIGTNCPEFDGSGNDDYIQVTDDNSLDFANFSVEFWFYADSDTHESGIISHNSGLGSGTGWNVEEWHEGICEMMMQDGEGGTVAYDGKAVTDNVWFHTMMCYDDTNIWQYRDGQFLNSSSLNIPDSVAKDLYIGCANPINLRYETDGLLDEIRLSNVNRSSAWVNTTFMTANSPNTFLSIGNEETRLDNIPPTVEIMHPHFGWIYFNLLGIQYLYIPGILFITIVFGIINVTVNASDNIGIKWVKFYVDNEPKATITEPPYIWLWDETTIIWPYTLKVVAQDYSGNEASEILKVWKMQLLQ